MGEGRDRLADRHHLSGLGRGGGDHAVHVRPELGIADLTAGEIEAAPGAFEPGRGLVAGELLPVEIRGGGVALLLERVEALEVGGGLRKARGRRGELGLGALELEVEVLRIEPGDDVAGLDPVADADGAGHHLAGDAEGEIGLGARRDHADEVAGHGIVGIDDARHLDRPGGTLQRRRLRLAAGEDEGGDERRGRRCGKRT